MKINWNKVMWRSAQSFLVFIMNGAIFAWFVMNFYGNGEVDTPLGIIEYSYWDTLSLKFKIIVYLVGVVGVLASIVLVKFLYQEHRQDKRVEKQTKELKNGKQKDYDKFVG